MTCVEYAIENKRWFIAHVDSRVLRGVLSSLYSSFVEVRIAMERFRAIQVDESKFQSQTVSRRISVDKHISKNTSNAISEFTNVCFGSIKAVGEMTSKVGNALHDIDKESIGYDEHLYDSIKQLRLQINECNNLMNTTSQSLSKVPEKKHGNTEFRQCIQDATTFIKVIILITCSA